MFSKAPQVGKLLAQANQELETRLVKAVAKTEHVSLEEAERIVRQRIAEKVNQLCQH